MKTMKLVTLCLLVEAESIADAVNAVDDAIGYSGTVHAPRYLACINAGKEFGQAIEQRKDDDVLSAMMQDVEVPIPIGIDFKVVDVVAGGIDLALTRVMADGARPHSIVEVAA